MKLFIGYSFYFAVAVLTALVAGCGTTAIMASHPLLASPSTTNAAKIYFIRPDAGFQGVKGNAFTISLDGQELLTLAKGEYTLVYLTGYSGDVTVKSTTVMNRLGQNSMANVSETRPFKFELHMTYYITFREGLRGYVPHSIAADAATNLARTLRPVGEAVASPL